MITPWLADLHVHTLLSPCAEVEMTPHHIVMAAAQAGVKLLGITDHNVSGNVAAAMKAAVATGVTVLPGMEIETAEEAHLVILFDSLENMDTWQRVVDQALPTRLNDATRFGAQMLVDEQDEFLGYEERMLLQSTHLTAREVVAQAKAMGGLCIASHVDRPAYSLLGQWGFLPPDCGLDAIEISRRFDWKEYTDQQAGLLGGLPAVTNSDAHRMTDFFTGPKTVWYIEKPTIRELRLALRGVDGRKVVSGIYLDGQE